MLCLGIETSCDETGCALVEDGKLVDETLASQSNLHSYFGGVVPELASREHYRVIGLLFDQLLHRNNVSPDDIDVISVTRGPGLLGSLLVGVTFAKGLALGLDKPIVAVNHIEAHALAAGLSAALTFPALALVVSGGHTHIYRAESVVEFSLLGRSVDDAAGEAFDKVGQFLGLPYPAGKKIDELGQKGKESRINLPRPYLDNANLDFSFSGLKTAACNSFSALIQNSSRSEDIIRDFCHEFNLAVSETLAAKLERALIANRDIKEVWLTGGVAANSFVREGIIKLAEKFNTPARIPQPGHCTDNAAMIAYVGYLYFSQGYCHNLDFETIPRGKKIPADFIKYTGNKYIDN